MRIEAVDHAVLVTALSNLAERWSLVGSVTYGRRGSRIAGIEALAHEVSHRLFSGSEFEQRLQDMSARRANNHEASALRVEVTALSILGCEIQLRTLWRRANWREDDGAQPPAWSAMTGSLTAREDRCASSMIRLLRLRDPDLPR